MKIIFIFLLFCSEAYSAQFGKIIVNSAAVRQYPNASSSVIGEAVKDQELAVSNLPTENFYKVRLPDGTMGWVSGNDVFVSKVPFTKSGQAPVEQAAPMQALPREAPPMESTSEAVTSRYSNKRDELSEKSRIILGIGLANLNYGGFPSAIKATELNFAMTALAEVQFKMSEQWFWAARLEFYTTSSGNLDLGSGVSEKISQIMIPVQAGIVYSPFTYKRFRFGAGLYLGVAPLVSTKVAVNTATDYYEQTYGSFDPISTFALQSNIGLSDRTGIFLEASYRYQKSGTFTQTDLHVVVPPFQADYSGTVVRAGLEFRL